MKKDEYLVSIEEKVDAIRESVRTHRDNAGMYSNYENILELLDEVLEDMRDYPQWERPDNLPEDMIWSEECNQDGQSTTMEYKADMSVEDFERMKEDGE